jgi:hypothetical protein
VLFCWLTGKSVGGVFVNNFFGRICVAVWRENRNFVVGLAATGSWDISI